MTGPRELKFNEENKLTLDGGVVSAIPIGAPRIMMIDIGILASADPDVPVGEENAVFNERLYEQIYKSSPSQANAFAVQQDLVELSTNERYLLLQAVQYYCIVSK
jgi:hypothetical protein